jgi:hypothetical protein
VQETLELADKPAAACPKAGVSVLSPPLEQAPTTNAMSVSARIRAPHENCRSPINRRFMESSPNL